MREPKQEDNVGNVGDVIKHASLVALLQSVLNVPGPVLYAETNAFRPSAPLPETGWQFENARLPLTDVVRRYQQIEWSYVRNGEYLCSPGIARAVLKDFTEGHAHVILCEISDMPESSEIILPRRQGVRGP